MYSEIDVGNGGKIIFFRRNDFWEKLLGMVNDTTEFIDIVTYNFNFEDQRSSGVYNKLLSLAEKGVRIRLMYSPKVSDEHYCDDLFGNEILCVRVPYNHSKIFISSTLAFVGSANFSLHSNDNYECGFLTENVDVIKRMQTEFINNGILPHAEIATEPCIFDPLSLVQAAMKDLGIAIEEMDNPQYDNEYVYFSCSTLRILYESVRDTGVCDVPGWLIQYCQDLPQCMQCILLDGRLAYSKEQAATVRYMFKELMSCLAALKEDILLSYNKYGKHNFLDWSKDEKGDFQGK